MTGGEPDEALEVLRGIWTARGRNGADLSGEHTGHGKGCKRMAAVGFGGLAQRSVGDPDGDPEREGTDAAPTGPELRAAWRARLEREGKLNAAGGSVRDLVFGPAKDR
jgi:hypothetical protein